MEDVRNILVPVDLSVGSRAAAQAAVGMAKRYDDAKVMFLHVSEPAPVIASDVLVDARGGRRLALHDYIAEQTAVLFEEFLQGVEGLDGVTWEQQTVRGAPHSTILASVKESACDLLVMGTHGRTGISHLLLGSVAEKVVRHATCPVLVVRSGA